MNIKETNHIDFSCLKAANKNGFLYICLHSNNNQLLLFYF